MGVIARLPKGAIVLPGLDTDLDEESWATIGGIGWWRATRPVASPLTRLSVDLGPDALPGLNVTVAISADGRRIVFPVRGPNGSEQLATRCCRC